MRAMALHEDVLVLTSRLWQTNATALRAGGECMLVDAPYFPDELEMLPGVLGQAGFRPDALLATHADYDHLLARLALPGPAHWGWARRRWSGSGPSRARHSATCARRTPATT